MILNLNKFNNEGVFKLRLIEISIAINKLFQPNTYFGSIYCRQNKLFKQMLNIKRYFDQPYVKIGLKVLYAYSQAIIPQRVSICYTKIPFITNF